MNIEKKCQFKTLGFKKKQLFNDNYDKGYAWLRVMILKRNGKYIYYFILLCKNR